MTKLDRIKAILAESSNEPLELAESFCALDDEKQAQFFIECARIMSKWNGDGPFVYLGPDWQMASVGRHLATCSCSTAEARDMVLSIASGIEEAMS